MFDDSAITGKILLQHMQAGFNRMDRQFKKIDERFKQVDERFERLERRVDEGFADANRKFEEARLHREALQEDLDATIRKQAVHDRELAMISGRPLPEDFD